ILPKKENFKNNWEEREEKNLFFTAITRPKIGLYITTSSEKEYSPFIDPTNLNLDLDLGCTIWKNKIGDIRDKVKNLQNLEKKVKKAEIDRELVSEEAKLKTEEEI
ncbi:4187_t:CDS:2, partial [Funneliformis geosporum]